VALETDIHTHVWPDAGLHAALTELILSREAGEPGLQVSNVGGWHSAPDLLESADASVSELALRIRTDAAAVGGAGRPIHAWANVMREGAFHIAHRHGAAVWSGVYYVEAGSDGSGVVTFARGLEVMKIAPATGLLVLFPSDLLHSVAVYTGRTPRISVGFNLC
jgi:hypothetical protein